MALAEVNQKSSPSLLIDIASLLDAVYSMGVLRVRHSLPYLYYALLVGFFAALNKSTSLFQQYELGAKAYCKCKAHVFEVHQIPKAIHFYSNP